MTVTTPTSGRVSTRRVIIGGQQYDKPWNPGCGACRSPWLASIDSMLAEGYALRHIRGVLAGVRPAVPNEQILRAHIAHLAEPHRKARIAFEEAAEARGEDTATSSMRLTDALSAVIARGVEQLASGDLEIAARDMLSAMKLRMQLERDQAAEGVEASAWQAAFMEFFEIVRRHLTPAQWRAFVNDVYASPSIREILSSQEAAIGGNT